MASEKSALVTEWFGEECVILNMDTDEVHRLEGRLALVWRTVEEGGELDWVDVNTMAALDALSQLGLIPNPADGVISRRTLIGAGATASIALVGVTSLVLPSLAMAASFETDDPYLWLGGNNGTLVIGAETSAFLTLVGGGGSGYYEAGASATAYYVALTAGVSSVTVTVNPGSGGVNYNGTPNGGTNASGTSGGGSGGVGNEQLGGAGGAASLLIYSGQPTAGAGGGGGGGGDNDDNATGYASGTSTTSRNGASVSAGPAGAGGGGFDPAGGGGGNAGVDTTEAGGANGASGAAGSTASLLISGSSASSASFPSASVDDPTTGMPLGTGGAASFHAGVTGGILAVGHDITCSGGHGTVSDTPA